MTDALRGEARAESGPWARGLRARAKTLLDQGKFAEAEPLYLELTGKFPDIRRFRSLYARTAIEACHSLADPEPRRRELIRYVAENIAAGGTDEDRAQAMWLNSRLCAWPEGREILVRIAKSPSSLQDIQTGVQHIPRYFEPGARSELWSSLLSQIGGIAGPEDSAQPNMASELKLRLLLALERFAEFVSEFDTHRGPLEGAKLFPALQCVRERLARPRAEVFLEPKVFGIGLSRTGTTSLAEALTVLGIDAAHWTNPVTMQILSDIDFFLFGACTDCCVSPEFEKLYYLYPNARFILTRRPIEDWVRSFWRHHERTSWVRDMDAFRKAFSERPFHDAAIEFSLYMGGPDIAERGRAFERRVENFFADKPANKLLRLDLSNGQGWPELCGFLGRPVPDAPFPRLNRMP